MAFMPLPTRIAAVRYNASRGEGVLDETAPVAAPTVFPAGVRLGTKLNAPVGARRRVAREALVELAFDVSTLPCLSTSKPNGVFPVAEKTAAASGTSFST